MNIDTATVEELWPVLAEKLPGLRKSCPCQTGVERICPNCLSETSNHSKACTRCHGIRTVPIAPSMERLLAELRKERSRRIKFSPVGRTVLIECQIDDARAASETSIGTGLTDLEALCRAAAKALLEVT